MAQLIWLVPLFPLVGVLINGLALSFAPAPVRRRYSGWIAFLAVAASFVVAAILALNYHRLVGPDGWTDVKLYDWIELAGSSLSIPAALRIDALSITMMLVVTGVGSLIHFFSVGYMSEEPRFGRFFTYLNLFTFAMLLLVLANNYVLMFVGWEGVGLCSYLLIGFWFEKDSAAQAGKKAFLVNRVGDFGFILGLIILYWLSVPLQSGSLAYHTLVYNTTDHNGIFDLAAKLGNMHVGSYPAVTVVCLLLFLGATGKSAQLPLYFWLPDAMEGPTPVSALIHAATMVTAGVYMVARSAVLFSQSHVAQEVVATVGIITALWAAVLALKQYDIKRVLAYSTISQLGYMFVGVGVGAYAAGISHLVTHAFFKALLFLAAGAVMHSLDGQLDMRKMGNVRRYMPVTFITFACGWYAICGLPLGAGFFSKDAVLEGAFEHGFVWIYWLGVVVAFLTALYMTRMFVTVFFGTERIELGEDGHAADEHGQEPASAHGHTHDHDHAHDHVHAHDHGHAHGGAPHVHPESPLMNIPLIVLAVLSLIGGILVVPFLSHFLAPVTTEMVSRTFTHLRPEHAENAWSLGAVFASPQTWISMAAAVAGCLLALPLMPFFARGWDPETEKLLGAHQTIYEGLLHALFVAGGTELSVALYEYLDRGIDWIVNYVAKLIDMLAESLRTLQTGYVRSYALVMLAGAVFVALCFFVILPSSSWPVKEQHAMVYIGVGILVVMTAGSFLMQRREDMAAAGGSEDS